VLILGHVRSLDVEKGRVSINNTSIAETLEGHEVFVLSSIIQPSSAESESAELAVDELEKLLGSRGPEGDVGRVEAAHVVAAFASFTGIALSSGSKGLDGVNLSFLHLAGFLALGDGDRLSGVDAVWLDAVTIEVGDALDLEDLSVDLDFSGFHHLLDDASNLRETSVDSCRLDSSVGGSLDGLKKAIEHWVEGDCEGTIDDAAIDLGAKVDLHDIVLSQDGVVTIVWGVVGGHVVQTASGGKGDSSLEPLSLKEFPVLGLEFLAEIDQFDAWLDVSLGVFADLTMDLGSLSEIIVNRRVDQLSVPLLLT